VRSCDNPLASRGSAVRVQPAGPGDAAEVSRLYFETVHRINARDYTARAIHAWAPRIRPAAWWHRRWRRCTVFVAVAEGFIVGFAELCPPGHIDCFYVHHQWQGRGVGSALMTRLLTESRRRRRYRLNADVSVSAQPFFRSMGFRPKVARKRFYRGARFAQTVMERCLR
jgi:putative acetyltransferase